MNYYNQGMHKHIAEHTTCQNLKKTTRRGTPRLPRAHIRQRLSSFKCHSLPQYCWPWPLLYDHSVPIFQLNKPSKKQISLPVWDDHDNMMTSCTIRVRLGCGATGAHGRTTDKSALTVWGSFFSQCCIMWDLFLHQWSDCLYNLT